MWHSALASRVSDGLSFARQTAALLRCDREDKSCSYPQRFVGRSDPVCLSKSILILAADQPISGLANRNCGHILFSQSADQNPHDDEA